MASEMIDPGPIIESWVRDFYLTMDPEPEVGNRSGDEPPGVKIIFDSYGYDEETDEQNDTNTLVFAVFVHKDSLTLDNFPEHDVSFPLGTIVNRPDEEGCIYCYLDIEQDVFDWNPPEDSNLDEEHLYRLIHDINKRDNGE